MDSRKIKALMIERGLTVDTVLERMEAKGQGLSRRTWYKRMRGENEFSRSEILALAQVLELDKSAMLDIFFTD